MPKIPKIYDQILLLKISLGIPNLGDRARTACNLFPSVSVKKTGPIDR